MTATGPVRQRRTPDQAAIAFRRLAGAEIRRWRQQSARLTREQLAPRLGLSVRTIGRWEDGAGDPRLTELYDMERIAPGLLEAIVLVFSTDGGKPVNTPS